MSSKFTSILPVDDVSSVRCKASVSGDIGIALNDPNDRFSADGAAGDMQSIKLLIN